jgi:hypothetical protein
VKAEVDQAVQDFRHFTRSDQELKREDTVDVAVDILKRVMASVQRINERPEETRERLYHLIYNATIFIFEVCN